MRVIILGSGVWGNAVASLFEKNGHEVTFWTQNEKIDSDSLIFSAIPTQSLREVLLQLGSPENLIFINGSKGIEDKTRLLPFQIVSEILGEVDYLTLIGPSFAEEVVAKMPTLVNLGYRNIKTAEKIKELLQTDYFRIRLTKSIRALELSAAFKNIYAIAAGIAEGLGYKTNTKVKIILLAIEELTLLQKKLDFKIDENALPATFGDLVLTCSSSESRNYTFGKLLAKNSPAKSLEMVGATVEGYFTANSVPHFEEKTGANFPLARFVYEVCYKNSEESIAEQFTEFIKKS